MTGDRLIEAGIPWALRRKQRELTKFSIVPRWYVYVYEYPDRDTLVFYPIGIHWLVRGLRHLHWAVRMQYAPERKAIRHYKARSEVLEDEVRQLLADVERLTGQRPPSILDPGHGSGSKG